MRTLIALFAFLNSSLCYPKLTSSEASKDFVILYGSYLNSNNGDVNIQTSNRIFKIDQTAFNKNNKTDLKALKERKSFKIKISEIKAIQYLNSKDPR